MHSANQEERKGTEGFTLIEMMVAMLLTSILVLGTMGVIGLVNDEFFKLTLKQKAALVLSGQTSRLQTLYDDAMFFYDRETHADAASGLGRWIYRGKPNLMKCVTADDDCLVVTKTTLDGINKADFPQQKVLFLDIAEGSNESNEENIVWLDYDNNVTAKLSWTLESITKSDSSTINGLNWLTVSLQYPYRFREGTTPVEESMGAAQTLVLRSMVRGRDPTLVGYYPFNGDAKDKSGYGNDGTRYGTTSTTDRYGKANSAYDFDGVNDCVMMDHSSSLNIQDNITISAWISESGTPNLGGTVIVGKHHNSANRSYTLIDANPTQGNGLNFNVISPDKVQHYSSGAYETGTLISSGWKMVTGTYRRSSGDLKLYIDGVLNQSTNIGSKSISQSVVPASIGCYMDSVSGSARRGFWNGTIDEVRIYNRELSAAEIQQLYRMEAKAPDIYLGCFKDSDPRDLGDYKISTTSLTIEMCIETCRSKGYRYAGAQYGRECFCGNQYGKYGTSDKCVTENYNCKGDKSKKCGGVWTNSVYRAL